MEHCFSHRWIVDALSFINNNESSNHFFGIWIQVSSVLLTKSGWNLKEKHSFGWIMVVAGILSVIAAVMELLNIGTGADGISILLGLQVLVAGIALVVFSLAKKVLAGNIKDKVQSFKQGL